MSDEKAKKGRADAVRGLASSVGQSLSEKVRQQLETEAGREAALNAVRGIVNDLGQSVADRRQRQAETPGADAVVPRPEAEAPAAEKESPVAAVRDLVGDVGHTVSERVRQGLGAIDPEEGIQSAKRAAAAVSGLVGGVGQGVSDLVRQEIGNARTEAVQSAKSAARGAGLLGGAVATGNVAVLFTGVAVWRGLGDRIGYGKSALVVAALAGGATAALATRGVAELSNVTHSAKGGRRTPATPPTTGATSGPAAPPRSKRKPADGHDTAL